MRLCLRIWVFLGVVGAIYSENGPEKEKDTVMGSANGVQSNSMSLEPGESHEPAVINIDDKSPGSGTDDATWSDDEDFSGDLPDDEDFSGDGSGVDEPEPTPVVTTTTTTTQAPKKTPKPDKKQPVKPDPIVTKKPVPETDDKNALPEEDEITVEPSDTSKTMSNEVGPGGDGGVEFSTGPPNALDPLGSEGEADASTSFMELLFSNPAILAAIIAGGVIALLAAILLVMFVVYRMRKKDEGSYSLDEPKKYKDPNMYWKDTGKEFYA